MKKINIKKAFINLIITTGIIFMTTTIIFSSISQYVFKNMTYTQNFWLIFSVSLISSLLLLVILSINRISAVFQVIIVYSFLSIVILITGYFLYIFDFVYNYKLLISTGICLITGLIIISLAFFIKYKKSDKSLNAHLKHFKERDL